ncbi:hypothetical protein [Lysobacter capsici]|uniref:hypothetical protein n=1 Tax=Lysobacter capsici TaxID=435897 RepID=UPI00062801F3|nr:hypothetical protein [Lysobacter capsici]
MKCFDVVGTVLDATYDEVPDKGGKRDELIANALKRTRDQYKDKLMTEGGPDFDDPATRFGYVFTYVPAHAHWVYELISKCKEVRDVFEKEKVRVACIGGGPGSDVVGVLKYLDESDLNCKLFIELIDGCVAWKSTWSDLAFQLDWDETLHTDYVIHDVADKATWDSPSKIAKADIITLSFFASEIFHLKNARKYLKAMLGQAKSGALVLVNDNRTPEVYGMLDEIAGELGFKTLLAEVGERKIYDPGESMAVVKKYAEKFGAKSRLTGSMCWRVYQKP